MRRVFDLTLWLLVPFAAQAPAADALAQSAADRWFISTDVQGLAAGFNGRSDRDDMWLAGAFVTAEYLEQGGIAVGLNATRLGFGDLTEQTNQHGRYLSGRRSLSPDRLPGRVTLRLDLHSIDSNSNGGSPGDAAVVAPMISYLSYDRDFYLDLGYSTSRYDSSDAGSSDLDVVQWTPTVGFALNDGYDWLQVRAYRIDLSDSGRTLAASHSTAVELKWTHWLGPGGFLGIDNVRISALGGERLYAVDHDAAAVYNLVDRQTGGFAVGAEWRAGDRDRLLVLFAGERYEGAVNGERYRSASIYLNWHRLWNRETGR